MAISLPTTPPPLPPPTKHPPTVHPTCKQFTNAWPSFLMATFDFFWLPLLPLPQPGPHPPSFPP
ncbi:hypothetical protein P691DRAFT_765799 [Macrolepiota fuliginosa MF-IS2]|uniref:Uncharacterized protein n=1 Tax=Macrolepiota fuliginosa MF-IS2 TaxID=1400762 RepID=A0A9P5WZR5_9AGAR|nr:hypothetical protein P691DRAFT_765799 [Macrolepiota fuliginosa MF-IS2]